MAASKPNLWSDTRSAVERFDPNKVMDNDPSRIPGYSEIVRANDVSQADDLIFREAHREHKGGIRTKEDAYASIGAKPRKLDVEFKWLPVSGVAGGSIPYALRGQVDKYRQMGFEIVRIDAGKDPEVAFREIFPTYGFPPAGNVEADGTIRRGPDTALYVRNGEVARRWTQYEQNQALERENAYRQNRLTAADGSETAEAILEEERSNAAIRERA